MMFSRYATAVSTGTFVTFGLLFLMQLLIQLQPGAETEPRPRFPIDWVKIAPTDTPVATRDDRFDKETLSKVDPTPAPPRTGGGLEPLLINTVLPATPGNTGLVPIGVFTDGPLVALVRVAPVYPARARARGIEGYVIVQFDVTPDGLVTNIVIVESTNRVFDKAAIKAAQRFKFKPRVVDGQPLTSHGIQNLFRFNLDDT